VGTKHDDVSTMRPAVADSWWVPAGIPIVVVAVAAWDERVLVVVFVVGWPGDVPIDIATPWREVTNYTRFGTGASSTRINCRPRTSAGSRWSSSLCCATHVPTLNVVSNTPPLWLTLYPAD